MRDVPVLGQEPTDDSSDDKCNGRYEAAVTLKVSSAYHGEGEELGIHEQIAVGRRQNHSGEFILCIQYRVSMVSMPKSRTQCETYITKKPRHDDLPRRLETQETKRQQHNKVMR